MLKNTMTMKSKMPMLCNVQLGHVQIIILTLIPPRSSNWQRFIPKEEVTKIMRRMHWDDENETWRMQTILQDTPSSQGGTCQYLTNGITKEPLKRPPSVIGCSRPTCRQAVQALAHGSRDPRYLWERCHLNLLLYSSLSIIVREPRRYEVIRPKGKICTHL